MSLAVTARAAPSRSPRDFSWRSSARKYTWNRRSPSSSSSFASSAAKAASATSYASSTVCGTIVRAVCSRSHGQSRRSRSVSDWRSRSAAPRSPTSATVACRGAAGRLLARRRAGRRGGRGARVRARLEAGLVLDLRALAEALLQVLRPAVDRLVLLLGQQLLLDLCRS